MDTVEVAAMPNPSLLPSILRPSLVPSMRLGTGDAGMSNCGPGPALPGNEVQLPVFSPSSSPAGSDAGFLRESLSQQSLAFPTSLRVHDTWPWVSP